MTHVPSGLLGHPQDTSHLARGDPILGVYEHPEGRQPLIQAQLAILKDRPHLDRELLFAHATVGQPTLAPKPTYLGSRAMGASYPTIGPAGAHHEGVATVWIREVTDGFKLGTWE